MGQLPNCSVEGHSHSGVLTQWISSHSITVPAQSDTAPENLRPRIDQVMEFIYAASQATDRDHTTGVISTLLYQVKTHIESANCHECLHYFTQEKGFEILVKIGLNESDRIAVVRMASQVIVGLCTAQLSTNAEALPSLLKVLCNICDYEYDRYYDIDDFLRGARFQMEQLSTTISPSTFFLVQKLISQLNTWAAEWENWLEHAQNISAFRDQIQRWAEPNASGHSPPESGDREPSGVAILNSISSVNVSPRDSAPGDSPPETRSTDLGSQTLSTEGAIVAELVVESAPTHDEEQPVDKSEEN
ncbi:hypothetical protein B0J17DRAFT_687726 [Rhizoctonia solani]|nr:hypothetical protein B0J17DRAFT_687726 [Rhizoctonia solani]